MKHKGTGYYTNPFDDAKECFLHEARSINRRITYCRYRARKVGALKRRAEWEGRAERAYQDIRALQRRFMEELSAH